MDSTASSPTPSILSPSCPPTPPKPFLCFLPISPGGCACGGASGEVGAEMASPSWGPRPLPRCVYANCFGSHPCGRSIFYEGLGLWRLQRHEAGKESQEVEAVMAATVPGGSSEPTQPKAERLPAPNLGKQTLKAHRPPQRLDQVARRRQGKALRAGDRARKENVSDTFEFYVPLNEAGKITKKKKKHAVWDSVYKVISKMLKENEKIRDRMNFKQGCSENGDLAQSTEDESFPLSGRNNSS
ncbi:uncharacterized protein C5orf47 homolog isoform X1 [Monodelphis domestica]|uniref:uncharacterized protein C5orf47 homolog isoform X1 n=1 Tax=Monodelphis domestica TaxID=13616 RepID=UPI0004431DA4|nr:uncharacterized protein C5orf47 homolog isoform X1 [Monodelphis domestica]